MIRTIFSAGMIMTLAFALAACTPSVFHVQPQVAAKPDKVSLMLADAADRASVSLETLAAVEQARTPGIAVGPADNVPPELKRAITVNWVGPVEPIAKTLADRAGYGFQTVGAGPPVPLVVSIDVENKPVIEVMRNLGLQLGTRADVKVDGVNKMVEIHYAPVTGAGG
jgi:defect-in-organelle-trafficking protein DotD